MAKLTPKQERFVAEYMVDLNATQAAIRAGYSPKTAFSIGVENLKKPLIQAAIQEARQAQQKRTEITADFVLSELRKIAADDADDGQNSRLRYTNKIRALELLGKHLGMFEKRSDSGEENGGGVVILPEIMEGDPDA